MSLEGRISRLEAVREMEVQQAWVDAYGRHGLSREEAMADWPVYRTVLKHHPAVPAKRGKVDIAPTLRALADAFGLGRRELLREAKTVISESKAKEREGRQVTRRVRAGRLVI